MRVVPAPDFLLGNVEGTGVWQLGRSKLPVGAFQRGKTVLRPEKGKEKAMVETILAVAICVLPGVVAAMTCSDKDDGKGPDLWAT